MRNSVWQVLTTIVLVVALAVLSGCGGTGSGGTGADSSAGSLALVVNKVTAASGVDTLTATVTLTSLSGQPVNGVPVSVGVTYNGAVVGTYSGNTNTSGVATIAVPIALVASDRTVYLQATSSGITSSSSVAVAVKAPVIVATFSDGAVTGTPGSFVGVTYSNTGVSFKDSNGNPLTGVTVNFQLLTNTGAPGVLRINGTQYLPGGAVYTVTGLNPVDGFYAIPIDLYGTAPADKTTSTSTFNYRISIVYGGFTYTRDASVQLAITGAI